jgi:hypothetical protein
MEKPKKILYFSAEYSNMLNTVAQMKTLFLILSLLFIRPLFAQPILIPYRIGNKFGLSDEKGKLIVKPAYDEIEYLRSGYFEYTNYNKTQDSVRYANGQIKVEERAHPTSGLFHQNKLLIANQPWRHYFIFKSFIIGSVNEYRPENCMLYNLKGEPLLPEAVKQIDVNYKRDLGDLGNLANLSEKLTLLSIFQRDENRRSQFSIAVYDDQKQKIISWLVKKVTDFKVDKYQRGRTYILCTYNDADGHHEQYLRFVNNGFESIAKTSLPAKELAILKNEGPYFGNDSRAERSMDIAISESATVIEEKQEPPASEEEMEKRGYIYYTIKKDSLFYSRPGSETYVPVPKEVSLIYLVWPTYSQRQPIIYKQDQKFGLILKGFLRQTGLRFADLFRVQLYCLR